MGKSLSCKSTCPDDLRDALNSPVPSIRTPFTADGEIDFDGVRSQVDFLLEGGARTLMLTGGDSLHTLLTDDEVAELARVVIEHNRSRAKIIAADKAWATPKAVAYAEYCARIGADLLMLSPPDWGASTTPDTLVRHFNEVGRHIPTMLVTAFFKQAGVFGARPPTFQLDVIRNLFERAPNQIAVKDDILGEAGFSLCMMTHHRWAIVSGGFMGNHMLQVPYGVDGYLCLLMSYKPEIAWRYFNAVQNQDFSTAWKIIREVERPLRNLMNTFEGGFNTVVHGMAELYGINGRFLRPPYHTMTDAQMEKLADSLKAMKLL